MADFDPIFGNLKVDDKSITKPAAKLQELVPDDSEETSEGDGASDGENEPSPSHRPTAGG